MGEAGFPKKGPHDLKRVSLPLIRRTLLAEGGAGMSGGWSLVAASTVKVAGQTCRALASGDIPRGRGWWEELPPLPCHQGSGTVQCFS